MHLDSKLTPRVRFTRIKDIFNATSYNIIIDYNKDQVKTRKNNTLDSSRKLENFSHDVSNI